MVSIVGRSEPALTISSSRYRGNNRQPRGNYNQSTRPQFQQHICKNRGKHWNQDHKANSQAIGQICTRCNKPNQLARVYGSNLTRKNENRNVNEISKNEQMQHEEQIKMVPNEIEDRDKNSC